MTTSTDATGAPLYKPPPPACCVLGQVYFDAYGRTLRSAQAGRLGDPGLAVTSALIEVVDHLVTMHDATGPTLDWCAGCRKFAGPPGPDLTRARPGVDPPTMSVSDWAKERRAHEVAHTVVMGGPLQIAT
ncbi:hypothetical protein [Streptomyces sp. NPDC049879]|uniref:hypothetical protein n=1 Tax=Streptomyces sp. NPDC049879 TaxID=3365598 RepID=UPI0037A9D6D1